MNEHDEVANIVADKMEEFIRNKFTMNKLTDAEIVKALEKILNYEFEEDKVPTAVCTVDFIRSVYNLINELRNEICYFEDRIDEINTENNEVIDLKDAEIEDMQKNIQCLMSANVRLINEVGKAKDEAKAEAIKEFAEKLTDRICEKLDRSLDNPNGNNYFITDVYKDIDDLVKEMVGETDGQADK